MNGAENFSRCRRCSRQYTAGYERPVASCPSGRNRCPSGLIALLEFRQTESSRITRGESFRLLLPSARHKEEFLAMPADIVFQRDPHLRSKGSCREPVIRVFPYPFKKGLAQINWCFALQFWTRQAVKEEVLILAELTRNLAGPTTGGAL